MDLIGGPLDGMQHDGEVIGRMLVHYIRDEDRRAIYDRNGVFVEYRPGFFDPRVED